jgi:hypothetical protein
MTDSAPTCASCGGPVEEPRWCYAVPTCYSCLPPPEPLPTFSLVDFGGAPTKGRMKRSLHIMAKHRAVTAGAPCGPKCKCVNGRS